MKIYTKTGDSGFTSLYGGERVLKNNLRIESYGTIDELNSYLGLIRDQKIDKKLKLVLIKIQNDLFTMGALLATPEGNEKKGLKICNESISFLENEIDLMNESLPKITNFILPGGHQTVSFCHIARCVCRRAERITVTLNGQKKNDLNILKYLNRLSDYIFVLSRKISSNLQIEEVKWEPK